MSRDIYAAPWAEPLVRAEAAVELVEYGPSAAVYVRQVAKHRDWSWRPAPRRAHAAGRDVVREYVRDDAGQIRDEVPDREREVYLAVHEQGHSTRWAARALGISRATVQTYLRRLRDRAVRWRARRDDLTPRPTRAVAVLARHCERLGRSWRDMRVGL